MNLIKLFWLKMNMKVQWITYHIVMVIFGLFILKAMHKQWNNATVYYIACHHTFLWRVHWWQFTLTSTVGMVTDKLPWLLTALVDWYWTSAADVFDRAIMLSQRVKELSGLTSLDTSGAPMNDTGVTGSFSTMKGAVDLPSRYL